LGKSKSWRENCYTQWLTASIADIYRTRREVSVMLRKLATALFALTLAVVPTLLVGQDVASLTGVVSDKTGAVVAGASVELVDTKTNTSYKATTNDVGAYTIAKALPGPGYKLTVTKEGFQAVTIANIYLGVHTTHTQNVQLELGQVSQTVEVTASGSQVSLNTTDTSVSSSLSMEVVHELPLAIRDNPLSLLIFTPGVTAATGGNDNSLGSRDGAVAGARGDQSNYTLDGLDTNDFGTGQAFAMTANAPIDSIQELRTESANPLSAEGRGSGAQVQITTKSGSNTLHGSLYDYNRTAATTANDFFAQRRGTPKPPLTRNQFGGSLGGAVIKDKLFYFFNYEGRRDARADVVEPIVPLDNLRAGNVNYINSNPGCTFQSRLNTTPNCISTVLASNTSFDPAGIGPDSDLLAFINSRYPHANDLTVGDGVNTGGFLWNAPNHYTSNDYVSRIDYNLSNKMKLFGRVSIFRRTSDDDINTGLAVGQGAAAELFPGDPATNQVIDHSWAFVVGHTWNITNNIVNQFNFGETRSILDFPVKFNPTGTTQYQTMMGTATGLSALDGPFNAAPFSGNSQNRTVPIPVVKDDFTYLRGKHNIQIGGTFKPIKSSSSLVNDFNDVTIGLGGSVVSLSRATQAPPDLLNPSATALRLWSQAYAFELGRIGGVTSNFNNDHNLQPLPQGTGHNRNYRYYESEFYGQDTWRIRPDLTMTYGLRWQYYSVPYEVNGFQTAPNIGFADMYNARATAAAAGISGDGVVPTVLYNFSGKANHAPGYYKPDWKNFAPRLSFAYNPSFSSGPLGKIFGDRKTVIRAGAGIVYDHTILSAINFFNDQTSFVFGQSVPTPSLAGLANDPRFSQVGGLGGLPALTPPTPASLPFTPYLVGGTTNQFNGLLGNLNELAIDPQYKTPYSEMFSFGFQRELPGNFLLESTYFLRTGHRLLSRSDAGQVTDFVDKASGQHLVDQFAKLSLAVRNNQPIQGTQFWENVMNPTVMANFGGTCEDLGYASCAELVGVAFDPLPRIGDMADTVEAAFGAGTLPANVGLDPQFSSQLYFGNKSYSSYNGLLTSLHKRMSHGLTFDLNYTYSHSIDNSSTIANNATGSSATGGYGGFLCDAINLRSCRGNSDFDVTHIVSANAVFDLPVGRGRALGSNMPGWANQVVGGWQLAGLVQWHTGFAFTTVTEAFPVSFNANSPAVFTGTAHDIRVKVHDDNGQIQLFADPVASLNAFTGPIGLDGPTRNNLRGPRFSRTDLSLNKHFPIRERFDLEFRAEAYNVFNHVNFALPGGGVADINAPNWGVISSDAGPRVMQFSLRLDF
jgi:hypothetical protein